MLTCDRYEVARDLAHALALWAGAPPGSLLVAGATDTLPRAREGRDGDLHAPLVVDVGAVEALGGWSAGGGRLRLGANVVFERFLTEPALARHLPAMRHCAVWFADDQIREQATLGGNVVNASPAADGTPVLLAAGATAEVARLEDGAVATREVALEDLVTGPGETALAPGEIVTAFLADDLAGFGGAFEKVGHRRSLVISVVCVACMVRVSGDDGRIEDVRLAAGGIGPVPLRLAAAEAALRGRRPDDPAALGAALDALGDPIASRTRRAYRRGVLRGFVARALAGALADGGWAAPARAAPEVLDARI